MVPPYQTSGLTVTSNPDGVPATYYLNTANGMERHMEQSGRAPFIGLISKNGSCHFYTQALIDEKNVRIDALCYMQIPWMLRNSTYGTVPVLTNGSYAGMTGSESIQWGSSSRRRSHERIYLYQQRSEHDWF